MPWYWENFQNTEIAVSSQPDGPYDPVQVQSTEEEQKSGDQ